MASLFRASQRSNSALLRSVASLGAFPSIRNSAVRRFASSAGQNKASGADVHILYSSGRTAGAFGFAVAGISLLVGTAMPANSKASEPDIEQVRAELQALVDEGHGPVLVRLAWHCAGTFDKGSCTGGSNGATMRFCPESEAGANAGLGVARAMLEPIKERNPDLSYADLWTLAGCVSSALAPSPPRTDACSTLPRPPRLL
eukprot:5428525-Pyramimonas_sp.AAC.1